MSGYTIVWHAVFKYQYEHLKEDFLLRKQVDKQLQVIESNPETAGECLKYMHPDLAGKIKKIRIGGRRKYRMFFKVDQAIKQIKIGFIDPRLRRDIDYQDLPLDIFGLSDNEIDERKLKKFIIK